MTNLNPLFDAMNNIDDSIITNAEKTNKKPVFLSAGIIAAALALVVGIRYFGGRSGITYVAPSFGESKTSSTNDSVYDQNNKYVFEVNGEDYYFNVYSQNIIIPDSFMPDDIGKGQCFFDVQMRPTEIFAEFGVHPLMNDNFTDSKNEPGWIKNATTGEEFYYNGGPSVSVSDNYIWFNYYLYNKTINKNIDFNVDYFTDFVSGSGKASGEIVYLKDGSVGIISRNTAMFAYQGAMYSVGVCGEYSYDDNDYIKIVLADLGVL